MKEKILKWYKIGLWTKEKIHNAREKKVITEEDYNSIINT